MIKYKTAQRKILQDFFTNHPHEAFSAKEILSVLGDETISLSAVYRNLSTLEGMNLIGHCSKNGTREAFFIYKDSKDCKDHIHLTCSKCGKIVHMTCADSDEIVNSVRKYNGFSLNRSDSIMYGLCSNCRGEG